MDEALQVEATACPAKFAHLPFQFRAVGCHAVAQKLPIPWAVHGAFVGIDFQLEPLLHEVAVTMPSADCCVPFPLPLDSGCFFPSGFTALPGYRAMTSPLITATSTSRLSGQVSDFNDFSRLVSTAIPRLWFFLFIGATFCLRVAALRAPSGQPLAGGLPSVGSFRLRLAADALGVQLTLPLAGCVVDLNHQVIAPGRAH